MELLKTISLCLVFAAAFAGVGLGIMYLYWKLIESVMDSFSLKWEFLAFIIARRNAKMKSKQSSNEPTKAVEVEDLSDGEEVSPDYEAN